MARIIVTTEQGHPPEAPVLLDERVCQAHLSDGHSAEQLMQRLRWAVADAEDAERTLSPAEQLSSAEQLSIG